jgi:hypothetical protein
MNEVTPKAAKMDEIRRKFPARSFVILHIFEGWSDFDFTKHGKNEKSFLL